MKSTSLILSVAAFFSAHVAAQENYSLWPRRPAELEQAQRLIRKQEYNEALKLLAPFVHKSGLAGHESRHLMGAIRVRHYLSPKHPKIRTHTVRRGENIERIATINKCPRDLIILINGLMDPSSLRVGQKLLVATMDLRAELRIAAREITVWDGANLVAAYDVIPSQDLLTGSNAETQLKDREGEINGGRIPKSSALFSSCNRSLKLADGTTISGAGGAATKAKTVQMKQKDLNELSLLLCIGGRISIVRDDKNFNPYPES